MWLNADLLVRCMQHVQADAAWQLVVSAGVADMVDWQPRLQAIMNVLQESRVLPAALVSKLSCWFQPLLVCLHPSTWMSFVSFFPVVWWAGCPLVCLSVSFRLSVRMSVPPNGVSVCFLCLADCPSVFWVANVSVCAFVCLSLLSLCLLHLPPGQPASTIHTV